VSVILHICVCYSALNRRGEDFLCIHNKFPNVIDNKVKHRIFVGPQIMKVVFDKNFERKLNSTELAAWKSKSLVCLTLWATKGRKHSKYHTCLLQNYRELGCWMSKKSTSHLSFFPVIVADVSDEQCEQVIRN